MSKHTYGPWVWNDKGRLVSATEFYEPEYDGAEPEPVLLIETDGGYYPPYKYDRLLIAAAPELLAVLLNDVCPYLPSLPDNVAESVIAVIKKATGEQP